MPELNKTLFTQVKGEVLFNTQLSAGAFRFYCLILYLSGSNTHCWHTQKTLAKEMGLSEKNGDRAIRNYAKECEQAGIMRVERPGYHQANKYYPLVKVIPQKRIVTHKQPTDHQDRTLSTSLDRTLTTGKSYSKNNIQYDRASRPAKGINFDKWKRVAANQGDFTGC